MEDAHNRKIQIADVEESSKIIGRMEKLLNVRQKWQRCEVPWGSLFCSDQINECEFDEAGPRLA